MEEIGRGKVKEFLKLSATGVVGAALASKTSKVEATRGHQWVMVIDVRRCIGCHACTVACKAENDVPLGVWRTHIRTQEKGKYPYVRRYFFPWICNHCGYCVGASQAGGLGSFYMREDGIVLLRLYLSIQIQDFLKNAPSVPTVWIGVLCLPVSRPVLEGQGSLVT